MEKTIFETLSQKIADEIRSNSSSCHVERTYDIDGCTVIVKMQISTKFECVDDFFGTYSNIWSINIIYPDGRIEDVKAMRLIELDHSVRCYIKGWKLAK